MSIQRNKAIGVSLATYYRIKILSIKKGCSMASVVEMLLKDYLKDAE